MKLPPIHNCIVQWRKGEKIYLNVFDTPRPYFFYLSAYEEDWEPTYFSHNSYEDYIEEVFDRGAPIYIPTTATTVEEARQLHPELLI